MELKLALNSGCSQAGLKLKILLPPHPEYSFRFWMCTAMPCLTTQLVIKQSESTQPRPPGDVGYSRESTEVLLCMSVLRPALVDFCRGRWQKLEFAKVPIVAVRQSWSLSGRSLSCPQEVGDHDLAVRLTGGIKQCDLILFHDAISCLPLQTKQVWMAVFCAISVHTASRVILANSQTALWSEPEGSGS